MGRRILIVEDNPMNMELASDLLEIAGYEVLQAMDAQAGIDLARSQQPDLILMDISLPGMDGLTATGILKGEAPTDTIPVIALTAHAMAGDEEKALAAGCDAYLTKPIQTRTFTSSIETVLAEFGSA